MVLQTFSNSFNFQIKGNGGELMNLFLERAEMIVVMGDEWRGKLGECEKYLTVRARDLSTSLTENDTKRFCAMTHSSNRRWIETIRSHWSDIPQIVSYVHSESLRLHLTLALPPKLYVPLFHTRHLAFWGRLATFMGACCLGMQGNSEGKRCLMSTRMCDNETVWPQ